MAADEAGAVLAAAGGRPVLPYPIRLRIVQAFLPDRSPTTTDLKGERPDASQAGSLLFLRPPQDRGGPVRRDRWQNAPSGEYETV